MSRSVITISRGSAVSCIFSGVSILERSSRFVMYTRGSRYTNFSRKAEFPSLNKALVSRRCTLTTTVVFSVKFSTDIHLE